MACYLGVDCGTQGTKIVLYDAEAKSIIASSYAKHSIVADEKGKREQDPEWWIVALEYCLRELAEKEKNSMLRVRGIGVSGQQHGLVLLDKNYKPLRAAKLWNDTETALENQEIIDFMGGTPSVIDAIGTAIPVGYTISKLRWVRKNEPELFKKIAYIINPKDYINFYLTGRVCSDYGSASGTGYFNVLTKEWVYPILKGVDSNCDFKPLLPELIKDFESVGTIRCEVSKNFFLPEECIVAAGSGDNMMAAVGTGNIKDGVATMTLGTSGVLSVFTSQVPQNYPDIIQIQNTMPDGWIPTICIMNATSTTTLIQELFALDLKTFDDLMQSAPIGSEGVFMFPFYNGERMPTLPHAQASISGLNSSNCTQGNFIRAAAESVIFGLKWGGDLLREKGVLFKRIHLVGGGSNSAPWRQIVADIFDVEVVGMISKEAGSLGGIIQAMTAAGEGSLYELSEQHIKTDETKYTKPIKENVIRYKEIYEKYIEQRKFLYKV